MGLSTIWGLKPIVAVCYFSFATFWSSHHTCPPVTILSTRLLFSFSFFWSDCYLFYAGTWIWPLCIWKRGLWSVIPGQSLRNLSCDYYFFAFLIPNGHHDVYFKCIWPQEFLALNLEVAWGHFTGLDQWAGTHTLRHLLQSKMEHCKKINFFVNVQTKGW